MFSCCLCSCLPAATATSSTSSLVAYSLNGSLSAASRAEAMDLVAAEALFQVDCKPRTVRCSEQFCAANATAFAPWNGSEGTEYAEPWCYIREASSLLLPWFPKPQCWFHIFSLCLGCSLLLGKCFKKPRKPRKYKKMKKRFRRLVPQVKCCRFVKNQRKRHARLRCRRRRWQRVVLRRLWRHRPLQTNGCRSKTDHEVVQEWSGFSHDYVNLLTSDQLLGGAAGKAHWPTKRRKGRGQAAADNVADHTRAIISVLKQCLNQGTSLHDVWNILQQQVPKPNAPKKRKGRKSKKNQPPHHQNKVDQHDTCMKQWTDHQGVTRLYQVDAKSGWRTWVKKLPEVKDPEHGKPKVAVHKPEENNRQSCWVTSLRVSDWDAACTPKLISMHKLRAAFKSGENIRENVVEACNLKTVNEFKTLWNSFGINRGMTVLLCGQATQAEGACHTRMSLSRGGFGHKLEHVALLKLGIEAAPWIPSGSLLPASFVPHSLGLNLKTARPRSSDPCRRLVTARCPNFMGGVGALKKKVRAIKSSSFCD